ncbi:hypothetical protein ApDm4_0319 [Acetobacter pomorum]|nr:hypothetical protein ApDm4_0319 [Acetobacter pomorum]
MLAAPLHDRGGDGWWPPFFYCHRISYNSRIKQYVLTTLARFTEQ